MIKLMDLLENMEIKNLNYFQQILDQSKFSPSSRKYLQGVIDSVKKQNNLATPSQFNILQRLKNGDFKYHSKN
jgi:hypothetical protein